MWALHLSQLQVSRQCTCRPVPLTLLPLLLCFSVKGTRQTKPLFDFRCRTSASCTNTLALYKENDCGERSLMKDFMANQFKYKGINGCYLEHNRRKNKNIYRSMCVFIL